jgi:dihydroorotate dehydrogenase electron transfer subunit
LDEKQPLVNAQILSNTEVAPGYFVLSTEIKEPISKPLPGQFVMLHLFCKGDMVLGRPFSIYGFSRRSGRSKLKILYRVVGQGTYYMSLLKRGASIKLMGPLGHGFELPNRDYRIALVSGGIGVAVLHYLSRFLKASNVTAYLGAKNSTVLVGLDLMEKNAASVKVATDDGSYGFHGLVTELLHQDIQSNAVMPDIIYTCGPVGMLRAIAAFINRTSVYCEACIEERMACGTGLCLGCAVAVKEGGRIVYRRVCKDGPVFLLRDLAWDPSADDPLNGISI